MTFSETFGDELTQIAAERKELCAITAAMSCGTGLEVFRRAHPGRFFDVGIAEGHAVTFAAGLAAAGSRPVVAVYSTFLQRAYDNLLHDVALQELPLLLCIDRAGLNPLDGPTHHGIFDVAMLSQLPKARIYAPVTESGLRRSLREALDRECVCAVRYPSGTPSERVKEAFYPDGEQDCTIGVRAYGDGAGVARLTVVTHGRIAATAVEAVEKLRAEGIPSRVLLCEYLAPYADLSAEVASMLGGDVLFLEEELRAGGFGANLSDALERRGAMRGRERVVLGVENGFVSPAKGETVWQAAGLDTAAVIEAAKKLLSDREGACIC